MSDTTTTPTPADIAPKAPESAPNPAEPEAQQPDPAETPVEGEEALGDPGKKAIDRMKAEVKAAKAAAKEAADERDRLKAAAEGKEAEWESEKKAREEADKRFNERILRAELKAAATGKLANPAVADKFIDLAQFEVADDGSVDTDAIAAAIDDLLTKETYLAAQGSRFTGTPDAGTRNETGPAQLTRQDLKGMNPQAIAEARSKGQLDDLLGVTTK